MCLLCTFTVDWASLAKQWIAQKEAVGPGPNSVPPPPPVHNNGVAPDMSHQAQPMMMGQAPPPPPPANASNGDDMDMSDGENEHAQDSLPYTSNHIVLFLQCFFFKSEM